MFFQLNLYFLIISNLKFSKTCRNNKVCFKGETYLVNTKYESILYGIIDSNLKTEFNFDSGEEYVMIENVIIFSKEKNEMLLTFNFGDTNPESEAFSDSLTKIRDIAIKLEKGIFNLDLDGGFSSLILAIKRLSVALVFPQNLDEKEISEWGNVANEIVSGFEKIYEREKTNVEVLNEYKNNIKEIVEWHLKEGSPIDKMKDALW